MTHNQIARAPSVVSQCFFNFLTGGGCICVIIYTVLRRRHSEEGDTIKVCGPDSGALQKMGLSDSAPSLSLPFVLFHFHLI